MYSQQLLNKIERIRNARERQRMMEKGVSAKKIEERRDLRGLRADRIWIDEATKPENIAFAKVFLKYQQEWEKKQLTTST